MEFLSFNCNKLIDGERRVQVEDLVVAHRPLAVFLQDLQVESNSELPVAVLREKLRAIPVDGYRFMTNAKLHDYSSDMGKTAVLIPDKS